MRGRPSGDPFKVSQWFTTVLREAEGNLGTLIRSVLDYAQGRSQGLESRLRDELAATNMADYPTLKAYVELENSISLF